MVRCNLFIFIWIIFTSHIIPLASHYNCIHASFQWDVVAPQKFFFYLNVHTWECVHYMMVKNFTLDRSVTKHAQVQGRGRRGFIDVLTLPSKFVCLYGTKLTYNVLFPNWLLLCP